MLIILAVISVNLVMNGNIIGRAEQSSEIQAKATELERLELVKGDVAIDNKGKVTVDDYIKEAIKQGITTEDEVEDNGDGSKNIITDNEWNVNIAPDPENENNVIITIDGKGNELPPRITKIDTKATKNSIIAKVIIRHLDGGTVKYSYKESTGEEYTEVKDASIENGIEITGLPNGVSYDIKVVVENKNGTVEEKVQVTTTENRAPIIIPEVTRGITVNEEDKRKSTSWIQVSAKVEDSDNDKIDIKVYLGRASADTLGASDLISEQRQANSRNST